MIGPAHLLVIGLPTLGIQLRVWLICCVANAFDMLIVVLLMGVGKTSITLPCWSDVIRRLMTDT